MKVKITNILKFQNDNAAYYSDLSLFDIELEVYALHGRKKKSALLFIGERYLGFFKLNEDYIDIIEDKIDSSWGHKKIYKYDGTKNLENPEFVALKLKDLHAPKWMLEHEGFLYYVYVNTSEALKIFMSKI